MAWVGTKFKDLWVFEPKIWEDDRGYFFESFSQKSLPPGYENITFVQDNESYSQKYVLRGLHYQIPPYAQTKLVRVVKGEVLDVVVDIRPNSDTYGQWLSIILNDKTKKQLLVPQGFAHGYIVLSDTAIFNYKCDQYYHPASEAGILYNDLSLGIDWILDKTKVLVSDKDQKLPTFDHHKKFI